MYLEVGLALLGHLDAQGLHEVDAAYVLGVVLALVVENLRLLLDHVPLLEALREPSLSLLLEHAFQIL